MSEQVPAELESLRSSIDNLDAAVIHIMAERFRITQRVGQLKVERGLPAADPARETQQIARLRALASEAHLDPEFAEKLLNFIVSEVVRHHRAIRDGEASAPSDLPASRDLSASGDLSALRDDVTIADVGGHAHHH